ncbi:MAG: T9SS type A sorting domain-containing protein [Saprospiraceae bacterium]|nr:T9SS type A sorting domain-containing protein [Saprospiraceae bacterium]
MFQYGQKVFPLAAYARGLYYQLTGEIMYPDIPVLTFDRSRMDVIDDEHVIPNPFYDQLHLEYPESAYLRIVDLTGKVMMTQQIVPGKTSFDTSNWSSGMYIVHVQDIVGTASSFKVIKQ